MFHKVISHYIVFLQNEGDTCREVMLLDNNQIHQKVNCVDGIERRFTDDVITFENKYKISIYDTPLANDLKTNIEGKKIDSFIDY